MADVAEDSSKPADQVQGNIESSTVVEQNENATTEEVKANGDTPEEKAVANGSEQTTETTKDMDKQGDDESSTSKSASRSPEHKRKEAPVSVSAHERHERKRSRGGRYTYNTGIKTRFEDQPESSDPDEIRRQVEFYFSDSNLPIDAYLLESTGGYRNEPVDLKVIHNFKRMRHFQPYSAVREAVAASSFLILSEDDEITRRVPLDKKFTDDPIKNRTLVHSSSMPRSIYAKGFGEETKSTQLDLEAFFEPYGPVQSVRMRRHDDGEFKGSVFVEFTDENTQQTFLELDPKPEFEGKELQIMSKQEYVDMKHEGILDGSVKPKAARSTNFGGGERRPYKGRGGGGDRRHSGGHEGRGSGDYDKRRSRDNLDKEDWKEKRERFQEEDDDRRDRHGGRGRGRGRGRGGRDRGRGDRRRSPDYGDRKRRRSDADGEGEKEDEAKKAKVEDGPGEDVKGDATAGAPVETSANGDKMEMESKKRAREDDGVENQGEAKKVKEDVEA